MSLRPVPLAGEKYKFQMLGSHWDGPRMRSSLFGTEIPDLPIRPRSYLDCISKRGFRPVESVDDKLIDERTESEEERPSEDGMVAIHHPKFAKWTCHSGEEKWDQIPTMLVPKKGENTIPYA